MSVTTRTRLYGVVPIIPIPFDTDDRIDEEGLRRLIEFAANAGLPAVCLPAYGSEFYKLTDEERIKVVRIAVEQASGRLQVIAQCNHGSARVASSLAQTNVDNGADLISVAVPRLFALGDSDLKNYLTRILDSVNVPCLVQDFNPGGPTVSPEFIAELQSRSPNFSYVKLEEPLMASKVSKIRELTGDNVGVFEGWGGLYMMELIPAGICGIMPGLGVSDVLNRVFYLRKNGFAADAFRLYQMVLPQIVCSLQNMEFFVYWDKRLLQRRGVLSMAHCRSASFSPDRNTELYIEELNELILKTVSDLSTANEPSGQFTPELGRRL